MLPRQENGGEFKNFIVSPRTRLLGLHKLNQWFRLHNSDKFSGEFILIYLYSFKISFPFIEHFPLLSCHNYKKKYITNRKVTT